MAFTNPFVTAAGALEQELMARKMAERQEMLDALKVKETEAQIKNQETMRQLQGEQAQSLAAQRAGQQASTVAEALIPDQDIDTATAETLGKGGLGALVKVPAMLEGIPQMAKNEPLGEDARLPATRFTGTFSQKKAKEAAEASKAALAATIESRESENEKNRTAAKERADESNSLKMALANIAAGARADRSSLDNQLKQMKIDAEQGKLDAAAQEKLQKRQAAVSGADEINAVISQLIKVDPKTNKVSLTDGTSRIVGGMRVPAMIANTGLAGGETANKQAALDRLKGQLVIDLMRELKSQSRTGATGFGALSEKELQLLNNSIAQLGQGQTEEQFARELKRIQDKISLIYKEAPSAAAPAAAGGTKPKGGLTILSVEEE